MSQTIFDKIVSGEIPSYPVWESDTHLAFLTPFPNTPGLTVVIPKVNRGDYLFDLDSEAYHELLDATKQVATLLKKALDVERVALVFEGTGVAHVHAKLYPLYGELAGQTDVWAKDTEFVTEYRGFITTLEGPQMAHEELLALQQKINAANT